MLRRGFCATVTCGQGARTTHSSFFLRPTAALIGATYAAAVGFSLVALGWHYPSDVAAAFCLCGLWACVAGLIYYTVVLFSAERQAFRLVPRRAQE